MAQVTIYTRDMCGYCARAKRLLDEKGVDYKEFNYSEDPTIRKEMISKANGANTFPQIFIGSEHIGGCDDLFALERRGHLDGLLSADI
ncbi:glutaredoxin 3 [Pseudovibrio denitrificans]|uniref:Glutaredoxin n=2 Tax=Pseudovibrio TaxID=258255 RepID=A0A1I7AFM3_9HYPH|nr:MULTISPECIES: glutaredoxin 3 [Pseudovibrio]EEA93688.1 glutaredoxin 3 [Pseudovibrio sp. JE062]QUS55586.1 glutaredoxin 3 [Pseudovibrio brasiliensis]SFT73716.1 glutaredoxin 3 [Pseudovibrio denitrificans]